MPPKRPALPPPDQAQRLGHEAGLSPPPACIRATYCGGKRAIRTGGDFVIGCWIVAGSLARLAGAALPGAQLKNTFWVSFCSLAWLLPAALPPLHEGQVRAATPSGTARRAARRWWTTRPMRELFRSAATPLRSSWRRT